MVRKFPTIHAFIYETVKYDYPAGGSPQFPNGIPENCLIQLTFNQNFWIFGYMLCAQDIHTKQIK